MSTNLARLKLKRLQKNDIRWRLLGGVACVIGGTMLASHRRPMAGGALMTSGVFLTLAPQSAIKFVPIIWLSSMAVFATTAFYRDYQTMQYQSLSRLAQLKLSQDYEWEFDDSLPPPFHHAISKPRLLRQNGKHVEVEIIGYTWSREGHRKIHKARARGIFRAGVWNPSYDLISVEILS